MIILDEVLDVSFDYLLGTSNNMEKPISNEDTDRLLTAIKIEAAMINIKK